jgi:hypothetical protein
VALSASGAAAGGTPPQDAPAAPPHPAPPSGEILAWEDDPGAPGSTLQPVTRPMPDLSAAPLPIAITTPRPSSEDRAAEFRYWAAADALARGRALWMALLPADVTEWKTPGPQLRVQLDSDEAQFNAYYTRDDGGGLFFYHDDIRGQTFWSGESPDVVCHELGHAVLDALRPQLWNATAVEPAAFHESFGDISALLCALELPDLREDVLQETGSKPWRSSRVSRLAEQLGWAIRATSPQSAEPTCLRDASNSWFYRDPATLPPGAPVTVMSTEPHAFSRIFTGAALKAIAGIFDQMPEKNADSLQEAGHAFATLLVTAIQRAPVVPGYYSQVAAHVLEADQTGGAVHQEALKFAFVRHGVLALPSAQTIGPERRGMTAEAPLPPPAVDMELPQMKVPVAIGIDSLVVDAAGQSKRLGVASAALDTGAVVTPGSETAAQLFVEDLFRQGRVDTEAAREENVIEAALAYKTHELQKVEAGYFLHRRSFDCGLHPLIG